MPVERKKLSATSRINNHRLCPTADDALEEEQQRRLKIGLGKIPKRQLADEAIITCFAKKKPESDPPAPKGVKRPARKIA